VVCKFFYPAGGGTWHATQYNPQNKIFFGYVTLGGNNDPNAEWGDFSLIENAVIYGRFGLGIERDLYFEEKPMSKVCPSALIGWREEVGK